MNGEIKTTFSNEDGYYHDISCYIKYMLENDKVLKAKTWVRQERNPDAIFKKYLEPLLYSQEDNV
jgi:galactose mutarotase-like enzyme